MKELPLPLASYAVQAAAWPASGRHILAHFDDDTIVVYQAYSPTIARYALEHGRFGDGFSYSRMSWIKPNFLWMMYRSDWARSVGQEKVLGLRVRRSFFDALLEQAVPSSFLPQLYADEAAWQADVARSEVRLQWDPDHLPTGRPTERRAVQLGLRGDALAAYGRRELLEVIDMTPLAAEQREHAATWHDGALRTPTERVYRPASAPAAARLGLDVLPA
jgi:hypothetical protein